MEEKGCNGHGEIHGEGDMNTETYVRTRVKERLEIECGEIVGPPHVIEYMRRAEIPDATGGLHRLKAPIVFRDCEHKWWWMGNRSLSGCRVDEFGILRGYTAIDGDKRKAEKRTFQVAGPDGEKLVAWFCDQSPDFGDWFLTLPLPLETKEDAKEWQKLGYDMDKTARQWASRLQWKGDVGVTAAAAVRLRWQTLLVYNKTPSNWGVYDARIKSPTRLDVTRRNATWPEVAGMILDMQEKIKKMQEENKALEMRLAVLEI